MLWVLTQQQSNRQEEETHRVDQGCHAAPTSRPPFPRKFSGARRKSQAVVVEEVVVVRKDQAAHTVLLRGAGHSVSLLSARQLRTPLWEHLRCAQKLQRRRRRKDGRRRRRKVPWCEWTVWMQGRRSVCSSQWTPGKSCIQIFNVV